MRHGIQFRPLNSIHVPKERLFASGQNIMSLAFGRKKTRKNQKRGTLKTEGHKILTRPQKCTIFRGNPKCLRNDRMFATCLIPKKMDPIIYPSPTWRVFCIIRFGHIASDFQYLRTLPTTIFQGILLLVLERGTHLLLYLLGAKFSDLTCHLASSLGAGPVVFPTPKLVPKKNIETQHPS